MTHSYPTPYEDADNVAFLAAWREGRLLLQQSRQAGRPFFYPRPICPFSGNRDLEVIEASGRGTIISYSLVYRPNDPAFDGDVPIILAEILLEEGASLLARIVSTTAGDVKSGLAVEIINAASATKYPLPTFRLSH